MAAENSSPTADASFLPNFAAIFSGEWRKQKRANRHHHTGNGHRADVFKVIHVQVHIHRLRQKHGKQRNDGSRDHGKQGAVRCESLHKVFCGQLFLARIVHDNSLGRPLIANRIADERQKGEYARHDEDAVALQHLVASRIRRIHEQRRQRSDKHTRQGRANRTECRKHRALTRFVGNGRSHRAVRNVDTRIAEKLPQRM